jgi:hypothetical protein
MAVFKADKTYFTRSACDHNCIFTVTVLSRTDKTIKAIIDGTDTKTLRISYYNGIEQVKPHGSYSMAPIIGADKETNGTTASNN